MARLRGNLLFLLPLAFSFAFVLFQGQAGLSACPDNPPINHRICWEVNPTKPAGWWEEYDNPCSANDVCCDEDGHVWCLVEMKNNTNLCENTTTLERKCSSSLFPLTSGGWAVDTTLSCNSNSVCCPNNHKCMFRQKSPSSIGVTISVKPLSAAGTLRTVCIAKVNVTQKNGEACFQDPALSVKLGDSAAPVAKKLESFTQSGGACTWIWNLTGLDIEGTYNFTFLNGTTKIVNKSIQAFNSSAIPNCELFIKNCSAFCYKNSSVPSTALGCGESPCEETKMLRKKDCGSLNNCGEYSFCASDSSCLPQISASWEASNKTSWSDYYLKMSAQVSYPKSAPTHVEFLVGNFSVGRDFSSPYYYEVPYPSGTNSTFSARAFFSYGFFFTKDIPFYIPFPPEPPIPPKPPEPPKKSPELSCDWNCTQYSQCKCEIGFCAQIGNFSAQPPSGNFIHSEISSPVSSNNSSSSILSFSPLAAGNHTVFAECLESETGAENLSISVPVESANSYFTLLVNSSCGVPNSSTCRISLSSTSAIPLELSILGGNSQGSGTASSGVFISSGWKGNSTIEISDISYYGKGPYELYFFVYPKGALSESPAGYIYSRKLVVVKDA